jgi:hypothetical protein
MTRSPGGEKADIFLSAKNQQLFFPSVDDLFISACGKGKESIMVLVSRGGASTEFLLFPSDLLWLAWRASPKRTCSNALERVAA